MAAIVTNAEVFDFLGLDAAQRTKQNDFITALVLREQADLERMLRRKLEDSSYTDLYVFQGKDCDINNNMLYLKGVYRDTYSLSSVTEVGIALTASTAYNDSGDYFYDSKIGAIIKLNGIWSTAAMAIKISGSYGYLTSSQTALPEIKQILIEMTAASSGLWKTNFTSENGTITTTKHKITKNTKLSIRNHTNWTI